jgi:hypothetical protein
MMDPTALSDAQFQQLLGSLHALKPHGGVQWTTVVPVFLSALSAMCVGIALEHYKGRRERLKAAEKKAKEELTAINVATVAMATNLELLIHYTFQNVIPHFEASHAAYQESLQVPNLNEEIDKFVRSVQGRYPHVMMTVPALNILEHDFLAHLSFAIADAPELLQKGNWFGHLARVLRQHFDDRNRQVELAYREALKGVYFNEIKSTLQIQESVGIAECVTMLQLLEQIQLIGNILECVGRAYGNKVGQAKKLVPPDALADALNRLRAICAPFIAAMAGGPPPPEPNA